MGEIAIESSEETMCLNRWKTLFQSRSTRTATNTVEDDGLEELLGFAQGGAIPLDTLGKTPYQGLTFLLVDDDADQLDSMASFLKHHGGAVDCAENGKMGLERYLFDPEKYDMIFLDIQMPVMNGDEAARQIRTSSAPTASTIPIVAVSGNLFSGSAKESGFDLFLSKPYSMEQLAYAVHHALKKRSRLSHQ